jgi:pyruvate formate lyase activating enzyme
MTCTICPRGCALESGMTGFCGVRANINGINTPINYGLITPPTLDPIEKKPLARYKSGSKVLSIGSFGCNFCCPFCQNHHISMLRPKKAAESFTAAASAGMIPLTPAEITRKAASLLPRGNIGSAYTYKEPLIGYEFVRDTAQLVNKQGMDNILVTNGCINQPYFEELLPLIDAVNIDLKAFSAVFYDRITGTRSGGPGNVAAVPPSSNQFLETVKANIALAAQTGHLEITCLVIPGENDREDEIDAMADFIAGLSPDIPLHITRFFPRYRYTEREPASIETVMRLARLARGRLRDVFTGNV